MGLEDLRTWVSNTCRTYCTLILNTEICLERKGKCSACLWHALFQGREAQYMAGYLSYNCGEKLNLWLAAGVEVALLRAPKFTGEMRGGDGSAFFPHLYSNSK